MEDGWVGVGVLEGWGGGVAPAVLGERMKEGRK